MKYHLVVALLLFSIMIGTGAVAKGSLSVGAGLVDLVNRNTRGLKASGFELVGEARFSQFPSLNINGSYSLLDGTDQGFKYSLLNDIALYGECRVYNRANYGLSLTAGWLNRGATAINVEGAKRSGSNYLTFGGKANYVVQDGLQAVSGISYATNKLFEEEAYETTILGVEFGVEYETAQVPGLRLAAYFLYDRDTWMIYPDIMSGFGLYASYAYSF